MQSARRIAVAPRAAWGPDANSTTARRMPRNLTRLRCPMLIRPSTPADSPALLALWQASVRATHDFLSEQDFQDITQLMSREYIPFTRFAVAVGNCGVPIGFLGQTGHHVDSLFIHPDERGRGIGRALLHHARTAAGGPLTVDVNEQNTQALGFYLHAGFTTVRRSPCDGGGRPYPVLHLQEMGR